MLQCVADCCGVLQCTAALVVVQEHKDDEESASAGVLRCVIMCCSVLQCVAVCCSVLQCVAELAAAQERKEEAYRERRNNFSIVNSPLD